MGIIESLQSVREYLSSALAGNAMRDALDDAVIVARRLRPFGPETSPPHLPADVPVYDRRGFRRRPLASVSAEGNLSLTYAPREEYDDVVSYYEDQLPARCWTIGDVHDDSGTHYRARRFAVAKGTRRGSIAVEETVEDLGPLERRLVTVSMDIAS